MSDREALLAETRQINVRKARLVTWWGKLGDPPAHAAVIDVGWWREQIEEALGRLDARQREIVYELLGLMGED